MIAAREIRVRGTVQGVGFRPHVWRLARFYDLRGEVFNDADGLVIRILGEIAHIAAFLRALPHEAPPLARVYAIEVRAIKPPLNCQSFEIGLSAFGIGHTGIGADAALCEQCALDIRDPKGRRYLYPFANCTHCGPRFSIAQNIPYDREQTTMAAFPICQQCREEYENPGDRRFHAQAIACHRCGPSVWLEAAESQLCNQATLISKFTSHAESIEHTRDCLQRVVDALRQGQIVAIRGIGGFHLCCDASNDATVWRLREKKRRDAKPFALMAPDLQTIETFCEVSSLEREQLRSAGAPIVLLAKRTARVEHKPAKGLFLSEHIAVATNLVGFMLPYTPLHRLVCEAFAGPLVMTSGNLCDEAQIIDNQEARDKLRSIANVMLFHDRDIESRLDDSVVRCMQGKARVLRRARGFAPNAIALPAGFEHCPEVLGFGGELKSTFCLVKRGEAILSQHQGDLEDAATFADYEKNLRSYQRLFRHRPKILVADRHPGYLSSQLARKTAQAGQNRKTHDESSPYLIEVQHHHAHIASCLAENGVALETPAVLGIVLDGLGFGDDGTLWGGEFLLADYQDYRRVGAFKPVAMPGGAQAIREPWRNAYAHILAAIGQVAFREHRGTSDLWTYFQTKPLAIIDSMFAKGINVPLASSCGRLFDAVAAALGIRRDKVSFEGQAAIELEMCVDENLFEKTRAQDTYIFEIRNRNAIPQPLCERTRTGFLELDPSRMWIRLSEDLDYSVPREVIATRFHAGLVQGVLCMVKRLRTLHGFTAVALSGGCLQNRFLLEGLATGIVALGLQCLTQAQVPSNDGGLSLGQAVIGAARAMAGQRNTIY